MVEIDLNMTEAYVPDVLFDCTCGSVIKLVTLRWRTLWLPLKIQKILMDLYKRSRSEGFALKCNVVFDWDVCVVCGLLRCLLRQSTKVRRLIQQDFLKAFENVDVIAAPSAPTTAYKIGANLSPTEMYLGDIYTLAVNLAGLPAINAPVGFDKDSLPVGLQLIGNYWSESQLLSIVHQYQQNTDWHTKRAAIAEENA